MYKNLVLTDNKGGVNIKKSILKNIQALHFQTILPQAGGTRGAKMPSPQKPCNGNCLGGVFIAPLGHKERALFQKMNTLAVEY